jgi:hypothetical protein
MVDSQVQAVDGYLFLYGGSDNAEEILAGALANGARKPCLPLSGSGYKAFIPIDADSPAEFASSVSKIIGGHDVNMVNLSVGCPTHTPGHHICPIKRISFRSGDVLSFALVNVNAVLDSGSGEEAFGPIEKAYAAIVAQGLTPAFMFPSSPVCQILVELQRTSAAALDEAFKKLDKINGIGYTRVDATLPRQSDME